LEKIKNDILKQRKKTSKTRSAIHSVICIEFNQFGDEKGSTGPNVFHALLRKSVILDAILGPSGFRRGSKNHVFGNHVGKKLEKGDPETVPEKT
jgi:hypothetical protein